jgi:hypothetical protein
LPLLTGAELGWPTGAELDGALLTGAADIGCGTEALDEMDTGALDGCETGALDRWETGAFEGMEVGALDRIDTKWEE